MTVLLMSSRLILYTVPFCCVGKHPCFKLLVTRKLFSLKEIATIIKTEWYWQRERHAGQWDRTDSQGINPCIYGPLIFDKCGKKTQSGMARHWENWISTCRTMKLGLILYHQQGQSGLMI